MRILKHHETAPNQQLEKAIVPGSPEAHLRKRHQATIEVAQLMMDQVGIGPVETKKSRLSGPLHPKRHLETHCVETRTTLPIALTPPEEGLSCAYAVIEQRKVTRHREIPLLGKISHIALTDPSTTTSWSIKQFIGDSTGNPENMVQELIHRMALPCVSGLEEPIKPDEVSRIEALDAMDIAASSIQQIIEAQPELSHLRAVA